MGSLYIVSTPIGNLQDITLRALEKLLSVPVIFSEQPSKTALMLSKFQEYNKTNTKPKIISLNEFEEENKIYDVLDRLATGEVAFVSEAGTPLISDPGFKLVRTALKKGYKVIPIPGPSSVTAALSVSGLPTDNFWFVGFLPKSENKRVKFLEQLKKSLSAITLFKGTTVIFFESPHRINKTIENFQTVFGNTELTVCRELTKIHEEVLKGTSQELLNHPSFKNPKGEFVVLFNSKSSTLS